MSGQVAGLLLDLWRGASIFVAVMLYLVAAVWLVAVVNIGKR